jgi:hypothetical protein
MPTYRIEFLLNVTRTPEGRLAVFDRHGTPSRCRAGDVLQLAGTLTADLDHPGEGLEYAFEAGNTPQDLPQARTYRSWSCRSVSPGDVVRVATPDGRECLTSACLPLGWEPVDLADYRIADPRARTFLVLDDATVTGPHTREEVTLQWRDHPAAAGNQIVDADLAQALRAARQRIRDAAGTIPAVAVWPTGTGPPRPAGAGPPGRGVALLTGRAAGGGPGPSPAGVPAGMMGP